MRFLHSCARLRLDIEGVVCGKTKGGRAMLAPTVCFCLYPSRGSNGIFCRGVHCTSVFLQFVSLCGGGRPMVAPTRNGTSWGPSPIYSLLPITSHLQTHTCICPAVCFCLYPSRGSCGIFCRGVHCTSVFLQFIFLCGGGRPMVAPTLHRGAGVAK